MNKRTKVLVLLLGVVLSSPIGSLARNIERTAVESQSRFTYRQVDIGLGVKTCTQSGFFTIECDCSGRIVASRFAEKVLALFRDYGQGVKGFVLKNANIAQFDNALGYSFVMYLMTMLEHITSLSLINCTGLRTICFLSHTRLRSLELPCTDISVSSAQTICEYCPELKHLNLAGCFLGADDAAELRDHGLLLTSDSLVSCCVNQSSAISVICPNLRMLYRGGELQTRGH